MTTWVCVECSTRQVSFKGALPVKCIGCGLGSAYLHAVDRWPKAIGRAKEIVKK
jgi:hypothetical protein